MKEVKENDIQIIIGNSKKPVAVSNNGYPLNGLDHRVFEVLTYTIFRSRLLSKDSELMPKFDNVLLMQGVGEKGMDCVLLKNGTIHGIIQCKKYSNNLSDTTLFEEITKFAIHYHLNKEEFNTDHKLTYYIATSTGYTGKALELFQLLTKRTFSLKYNLNEYIE